MIRFVIFITGLFLLNWMDLSIAGPTSSAADAIDRLSAEMQQLRSHIHQLEAKESAQQLEIDHLKTKGMEMDKYIQALNEQVEKLQAHQQTKSPDAIKQGASGADGDDVVIPNGSGVKAVSMPTSCGELFLYGYTLPGFYMVKGSSNTVNTVFCDFSVGFGNSGYQTMIGFNDIKTTSVYFYVQRNEDLKTDGTIPYEITVLNVGEGLNSGTGVFTAPVSGRYYFSFSARAQSPVDITLHYCSSGSCGYAHSRGAALGDMTPLRATLNMKKGDYVFVSNSGNLNDSNNGGLYTQFSGFLLEEDLNL